MALKEQALKKRLLASAAFISVTLAVSANAADITGPPPPAAIWSWSGFYFGAHAGYGWGRDPFNDAIFSGKAPLTGINSNGIVGGFQAGANWQAGALVGGLEIDLSATGIKGSTSVSSSAANGQQVVSISQAQTDKFEMLGSARGRLGYAVWPNVLLYGTGGLAWTRLDQMQGESIALPPGTIVATSSTPSWRFGWVAGLGAETRIWETNWLARVEYLHYDFGDSGSNFSTSSSLTSGHLTNDVVRAGLSYKFGQDLFASAGPANWAMPVKAPRAAAMPWNWSGFYLGAHAGYGWGRDPFSNPDTLVLNGVNSNGFAGGLQAGANWQSGAWVGGFEVDLSATTIKGSTSGTNTVTMTDNFDMFGSARARLGYVALPNVLLYGTGGLAWTRLEQTTNQTDSGDTTPSWRFGWAAGLGAETRIRETNWLARVEYLHYDFGDSGSSFSSSSSQTSGHLTNDVVRAGLSYKFGQDLIAATGPATTAMPLKTPPAAALPRNWSGFYLGGHAGYGWGSDPRSDAVFGSKAPDTVLRTAVDSRGFVGGFQAGANWQRGAWVSGLEIDLSATGIKGSTTNVSADGSSSLTVSEAFNLLGSTRARLGYVVWPNVMLYGTGGLAWTRLQTTNQTDSVTTTPSWQFGWVAGLGGETRLMNTNWLVRLEYLHYDFGNSGSSAFSISGGGPSDSSSSQTSGHLTNDVVRTGLSFKFD